MAELQGADAATQALATEIAELGKEIQAYTHGADKYFAIATTVIVAAITLSVSDKFPAALVALPFALSGIFLYVMQLFTERAARIGMRRFLEKYIRSSSSYWFVNKEDCLNKAVNQRRPSVIISTGLYTAGYLGSCWIAIDAARQLDVSPFHDSLPEVVLGALVAVTIALLVTYIELARADRVAFSFMENYDPNSNQAALAGRG